MEKNKYSSIFKKNFAIMMIKPDGLDGHNIDIEGKTITMNKDFIMKEFSKISLGLNLCEKEFLMVYDIFKYYKPTKTEKKSYLDYHLNKNHNGATHVVFLISDEDECELNSNDNLVDKIYNFKKNFRKVYSEQEKQRDQKTGAKKSVKTLIHSPEDYFELISNLALFFPEKLKEFVDIEKIELIEALKEECCKKKISELTENYYNNSRKSSFSSSRSNSESENSMSEQLEKTKTNDEDIVKRINNQYNKFFEIIKYNIEKRKNACCEYIDCQRKQPSILLTKKIHDDNIKREEEKERNNCWTKKIIRSKENFERTIQFKI